MRVTFPSDVGGQRCVGGRGGGAAVRWRLRCTNKRRSFRVGTLQPERLINLTQRHPERRPSLPLLFLPLSLFQIPLSLLIINSSVTRMKLAPSIPDFGGAIRLQRRVAERERESRVQGWTSERRGGGGVFCGDWSRGGGLCSGR